MIGHRKHFCGTAKLGGPAGHAAAGGPRIYFRGYLSNQKELGSALGLPGADLPELIAAAYGRWGRGLPTKLDGQFALVVMDSAAANLLIARDALGIVPLYWKLQDRAVHFSSRMTDLVDEACSNALNLKEVERYILFGGTVSDQTCYRAIRRLEPGQSIWIHRGQVSHDAGWDPRSLPPVRYKNPRDYIDHFLDLVDRSVSGALADSRAPWIALSGGLDSNTILHPALRRRPELQAYSIIAPQWPEEDESRWIRRITARQGLRWTTINAEEILPFGDLPDEFCGSPDAVVLYDRLNSRLNGLVGGDVLLTGDGGDSFMGAQMGPVPSHLADPLFGGSASGVIENLRRWASQSIPERSTGYWLVQGLLLPSLRHLLRRNVRQPHYHLHPAWLGTGRPRLSGARPLQPKSVAARCRAPGQQAILDDLWQCAEDTTAVGKTYSNRHPLFHRALFEFLWSIPWSQKQLPLCDRYLQRRALKGLLDDDMRTRISYGIGSRCLIEGLRRSAPWQDYLCDDIAIADAGFVKADAWRKAIQQACVGQTSAEPLLVRAMTVEVWLKQLARHRRTRARPENALEYA